MSPRQGGVEPVLWEWAWTWPVAAVAGSGSVPTSLLSYVFLSWSCFHSHSFGPGCWEEAWETSVWSLAAGGAGEEERAFSPVAHQLGSTEHPRFVSHLIPSVRI